FASRRRHTRSKRDWSSDVCSSDLMTYPMSVGRNFAEIVRALDAVRATDGEPIATPADWVPGQDVIVGLSLNDEEAAQKYGELNIKLPYLRFAKDTQA